MRVITECGRSVRETVSSDATNAPLNDVNGAPDSGSLQIVVPGSSLDLTRAALDAVSNLAKSLQVGTTLVSVQVVPYTLPLDSPPISSRFYSRCLEEIVSRVPLPLRIELLLARDHESALKQYMPRPSTVLIVARTHRWWRKSAEEKLACALRRAGHKVALVTI